MISEALHIVLSAIEADLGPLGGEATAVAGTAPGHRILVDIAGVGRAFIKASDGSPEADEAVGAEAALLTVLEHRNLPRVMTTAPTAEVPYLVLHPLAEEGWTPPWPAKLRHVWSAIDGLSGMTPPPWLPEVPDTDPWQDLITTVDVHGRSQDLQEAAARVSIAGTQLVHGDLGGGNVHVQRRRVTVVDWSDAFVGNADLDRTTVAVDAAHHDGRRELPPVADPGAWLAKTAGLLLAAAARAPWPGAGGREVRAAQAEMARTAVDWAVELL